MLHFSTTFIIQTLPRRSQFSYTSFVLEISLLLPPPSTSSRTHPLLFRHTIKTFVKMLAPDSETEDNVTLTLNLSKVHSLKAAIFHRMAFQTFIGNQQK